jgi:hypothetical protein
VTRSEVSWDMGRLPARACGRWNGRRRSPCHDRRPFGTCAAESTPVIDTGLRCAASTTNPCRPTCTAVGGGRRCLHRGQRLALQRTCVLSELHCPACCGCCPPLPLRPRPWRTPGSRWLSGSLSRSARAPRAGERSRRLPTACMLTQKRPVSDKLSDNHRVPEWIAPDGHGRNVASRCAESAVARLRPAVDTEEVTGSIPVSPTSITAGESRVPPLRRRASCCFRTVPARLPARSSEESVHDRGARLDDR